jgi:hypothetical protein
MHMLTFCILMCSLVLILVFFIILIFKKFLWHKICFVSIFYSFFLGIQHVCFKLLYLWQSALEVFISEYETLILQDAQPFLVIHSEILTALYPIVNTQGTSFHFTSLNPTSIQSHLALFSHILDL